MPQLTWLVTGCSSGLGEAFVKSILGRGDSVIATARGDIQRIAGLAEGGAKTISLDVTAPQSEINATIAEVLQKGPIDVLVNCAGYIEAGIAEEASYESYLAQFETNFFGVIKVTQAVLPHFREKKSGTMVFISSSGGIRGDPGAAAYCASKFALEGWYDSLRQETAHLNIRNVIFELGFFRTKIMHPDNIKFDSGRIADYNEMRDGIAEFVRGMNGTQAGDPDKAVSIMIDVVKGEGIAEGKPLPARLPIGPDMLQIMKERCANNLEICKEWETIICSTNYDN